MTDTKRLSLHGRLRMAAACPDPNASLLAEAADAIEQHEAFRQEVSDAVEWVVNSTYMPAPSEHKLRRFIIAKPDPLVEVLQEISGEGGYDNFDHYAYRLRSALEARGLEVRKIGETSYD